MSCPPYVSTSEHGLCLESKVAFVEQVLFVDHEL